MFLLMRKAWPTGLTAQIQIKSSMRRSNAGVLKLATRQSMGRTMPFVTSTRSMALSAPASLPRLTPGSFRSVTETPISASSAKADEQPAAPASSRKPGRKKRVTVTTPESQSTTYNPVKHIAPSPSSIPPPKAGNPRPVPDLENGLRAHLLVSLTEKVQFGSEEPVIATVCPYEGGDSQCLEVVKTAVGQIEGDIVEIDLTAALALGAYGPLGKAASCIQLPVNPLQDASSQSSTKSFDGWDEVEDPNEDGDESMVLPGGARIVRLNLSKNIPGLSGGPGGMMEPIMFGQPGMGMGMEEDAEHINPAIRDFFMDLINTGDEKNSKPRVIFLRDAAGMHATFDAWWPSFVSAVNLRRRGAYNGKDQPGSELVNPTTIVLGVAPSLLHVGNHTGGGPTTFPLFGARQALYQALDIKDKASTSANSASRRRTKAPHQEADEAKLWMSSPETDEAGRELRATKRMNAMDNGVMDLPYVLPPFGPKLSDIPPAPPPSNPLASLLGGGNSSSSLGSISTKFPWRTVPIIPPQDLERDMIERHQRRQLLNALQIGRAMSELGGKLQDPMSAVGNLKNKSSRQLQESLELEEITAQFPLQILPWIEAKQLASLAIGSALQVDFKKPAGQELVIKWRDVLRAAVAEGDARIVNSQNITKRNEENSSENLRKAHRIRLESDATSAQTGDDSSKRDQAVDDIKSDRNLSQYEKRLLGCIVDPTKLAETSFRDVHLPEKTVDGIRSMVSMPLLFPEAFSSGILKKYSSSGALLFGPPGTGKTLLARALAAESGARMLAIQPSDVNDMYVGEGEKLVKAVFSLARRLSPCIVFLDEVDSLFGKRSSHSSSAAASYRQILTEFMQEMDGLSSATANKESKVMVIGATNRPFDLDEAVLRRLPRRMLVDLPDADAREKILKIMLRSENLAEDVDLKKLAQETVSFSGSDLKHLCVNAAYAAIKEEFVVPWKQEAFAWPASPPVESEPSSNELTEPSPETEPIVIHESEEAKPQPQRAQPEPITASKPVVIKKSGQSNKHFTYKSFVTMFKDGRAVKGDPKLASGSSGNSSSKEEEKRPTRTLTAKHFKIALTEIRASASEDGEIAELRKWSDRFGEGGTQRGKKSGFGGGFGFGDGAIKQAEYGSVKQD